MADYGCALCLDEGRAEIFYPASVQEQMKHAKEVHGSARFDHPSWREDSALELLSEIMGLPAKSRPPQEGSTE